MAPHDQPAYGPRLPLHRPTLTDPWQFSQPAWNIGCARSLGEAMLKLFPCTLALVCLSSLPALAQEAASASVTPRAGTSPTVTNEEAHAKALLEYWTPERLASAIPMPIPRAVGEAIDASATPASTGPVHSGAGGLPSFRDAATSSQSTERFSLDQGETDSTDEDADALATPAGFSYEMPFNNFRAGNRNTYPYSAIGKLFFTIPPGTSEAPGSYVCSAAVGIQTHIVITARHCVFDIVSKKFYTNWIFYPAGTTARTVRCTERGIQTLLRRGFPPTL